MKTMNLLAIVMAALLLSGGPLLAQDAGTPNSVWFAGAGFGAGLGMALTVIGAGYGLGRIGSAALESMARQPEVADRVQVAMIIVAAMLEGATLASVVLCFVVGLRANF